MPDITKPNYFSQHLTFKQSAMIIPKTQLRKGMVIQTRYKNLEQVTKDYMFVVLHPMFFGKVHTLSLNEFTNYRINELARRTGIRIIKKYKKHALNIPKLVMNESAQRFYYGTLAKNMERLYNNSYRTLFANNISLIQLIDYRFDSDVMDTLGLQ